MKGKGAGGANTNIYGKKFEEYTDAESVLMKNGFKRVDMDKKHYYLIKESKNKRIIFFKQHAYVKYMKTILNYESSKIFRIPDEAYLIEDNNGRTLKILEKKEQHVNGSVETKLYASPSLKLEYELVFEDIHIEYALCVNYFFKNNLNSNKKKFNCLKMILNKANIPIFYGEDTDYFDLLFKWIGNKLISFKPVVSDNKQIMTYPKPYLKWVGGKTQIVDQLIQKFPKQIRQYNEIFLGGGSVLLAVCQAVQTNRIRVGKIYAFDINEPLVYTYKNIQQQVEQVEKHLEYIVKEFKSCDENTTQNRNPKTLEEAKNNRESYYYWIRNQYNALLDKKSPFGSALFIFLNKTCFRGLFRTGKNGFNVPYGNYKNPEIYNHEHLLQIHHLIQDVEFDCCSFENSIKRVEKDDFIYLDPPYVDTFNGYTSNGFDHDKFFKLVRELKVQFLMSNSESEVVRNQFPETEYTTETIVCKRHINSKNPAATANEVLIYNQII